jgi:hypothetical protein
MIGHVVKGSKFPNYSKQAAPNNIVPTPENIVFNPKIHLAMESPAYIKTIEDKYIPFPVPLSTKQQGCKLAYSAPFKLLSDEGVRAIRSVIKMNEHHACSNNRQPKSIRGIGYRSKFIRDFTYSKDVLQHLTKCSGKILHPHTMGMNVAQINFGKIGGGAPDIWHIDSVPFVMVLLLSDTTDMVGGKLQVARISNPNEALDIIREKGKLPEALIDTVNYPGAGYCIFMQGSRIAHAVTPVESAREERLTLVNSFQSLQPFDEDRTIYSTFHRIDGNAPKFEYARHKAWLASGKLDYLLNEANLFGETKKISKILDLAIDDLRKAKNLINETVVESLPWSVNSEIVEKDKSTNKDDNVKRHSKL